VYFIFTSVYFISPSHVWSIRISSCASLHAGVQRIHQMKSLPLAGVRRVHQFFIKATPTTGAQPCRSSCMFQEVTIAMAIDLSVHVLTQYSWERICRSPSAPTVRNPFLASAAPASNRSSCAIALLTPLCPPAVPRHGRSHSETACRQQAWSPVPGTTSWPASSVPIKQFRQYHGAHPR